MLSAPALRLAALSFVLIFWTSGAYFFPVIGPHATIKRLRAEVSDVSGQLKAADAYGKNREAARISCEAARQSGRDDAAQGVADAAQRNSQTASQAFNSGFAAGKIIGRKACTPESPANASPPVDPVAVSGPGVVRDQDLADTFNASAYRAR